MILIVLGLVWLGLFVAAVACFGQAGVERSQSQAGVQPRRKTTGRF